MNNSNTNYVCTIIDLISTHNVRSEALETFFESMASYGEVITMQSQYRYT